MVRARTVISRRGIVVVLRFGIGTSQRFICIALHGFTIDGKRSEFNFTTAELKLYRTLKRDS